MLHAIIIFQSFWKKRISIFDTSFFTKLLCIFAIFNIIILNFGKKDLFSNISTKCFNQKKQFENFTAKTYNGFSLDPIQDGLSQDRSGMGGVQKTTSLESVTRILQWWNLTVISYTLPKKDQKISESGEYLLTSAASEISEFCYIKKHRYRLHFDT